MNVALQQKEKLQGVIREALLRAQSRGELSLLKYLRLDWRFSGYYHGDFASNIALVTAKKAKKSPRDVAAIIVGNMEAEGL